MTIQAPAEGTDLLNSLAQRLPGVLYRCALDADWTMHYISPGIEALSGYPAADFIGNLQRSYASLIHPDDRPLVDEGIRAALARGEAFDIEYRVIDRMQRVRHVHECGKAVTDAQGQALYLDGVVLETTRAHRLGEQLAAIVEHTPNVAIQCYDEQGVVLRWNPAAERLFGWTAEQAIGRRLDEFLLSPQDFQAFVAGLHAVARTGVPTEPGEWTVVRPDGSLAHCLATQFEIPSLDAQGRTFICMDVDVGELHAAREALRASNQMLESRVEERTQALKQALAQLMETERLASLGSIVAGVAHEMNTPIGNARSAASALKDWIAAFGSRLEDGVPLRRSELARFIEQGRMAVELLERSTLRAAEQIQHFRQLAVDQHGQQRRRFALATLFADLLPSLRLLFRGTPHRLEVVQAVDVDMDSFPGPLEQVLTNLVQNALVHGLSRRTDGGCVRIEVRESGDASVVVEVMDDGVGIADEIRGRVFEPFFTTRLGQGGSGLGLHIAYTLSTGLLGGRIDLLPADATRPGTAFRVCVPRVAPG